MLILSRKVGETIKVGDSIEVTILSIHDGRNVRIGVNAPRDVSVHREEVYHRIQKEKREGA